MNTSTNKMGVFAGCLVLALSAFAKEAAAQSSAPAHVAWAEDIALHVTPEHNEYGFDPTFLTWAGVDGATVYENRTVCNTFVTRVLKRAYGWTDADFRGWFGVSSPLSTAYHDKIVAEDGFAWVQEVESIEIGDIVAMSYPADSSSSGHVMIATSTATPRATATKPLVPGTFQYEIEVVDSTRGGHGNADTRKLADGSWDAGAGFGVVRLYADGQGLLVGYTWSTLTGSVFYPQSERPIAVGRLTRAGAAPGARAAGFFAARTTAEGSDAARVEETEEPE